MLATRGDSCCPLLRASALPQVLGLAIYNGVLLDFPLPLALYRKILGQEVKLRDLEDMQPTLGRWVGGSSSHNSGVAAHACLRCGAARPVGDVGHVAVLCTHMLPPAHCCAARRSLRQLLQYEGPGSVEDVFCQTFTVEVPGFGDTRVVPLKEGGADVPVTGGRPRTGEEWGFARGRRHSAAPAVGRQSVEAADRPLPTSAFLHHPLPRRSRGEPARVCGAVRRLLAQRLHPLPVRGLCQGLPHALWRPSPAGAVLSMGKQLFGMVYQLHCIQVLLRPARDTSRCLPAASRRPVPCSHHPPSQLFSATELERLVCGNPFLDFDSLQKHARYEGGYSPGERGKWDGAAGLCCWVRV